MRFGSSIESFKGNSMIDKSSISGKDSECAQDSMNQPHENPPLVRGAVRVFSGYKKLRAQEIQSEVVANQ